MVTLKQPSASVNPDSQAFVKLGLNRIVIGVIVEHKPYIIEPGVHSFRLISVSHLPNCVTRCLIHRLPLKRSARRRKE